MADFNLSNMSTYSDLISNLDDLIEHLAKQDMSGDSNIPTDALRINPVTKLYEKWNGTAWVAFTMADVEALQSGKEDSFSKNSGFNKDKTDSYNTDNSNLLATAKAVRDGLATKANSMHTHGNLTNDGKIGSASGQVITTGASGILQAIAQATGFNLPKTDAYTLNNSGYIATAKALYNMWQTRSNSYNTDNSNLIATAKAVRDLYQYLLSIIPSKLSQQTILYGSGNFGMPAGHDFYYALLSGGGGSGGYVGGGAGFVKLVRVTKSTVSYSCGAGGSVNGSVGNDGGSTTLDGVIALGGKKGGGGGSADGDGGAGGGGYSSSGGDGGDGSGQDGESTGGISPGDGQWRDLDLSIFSLLDIDYNKITSGGGGGGGTDGGGAGGAGGVGYGNGGNGGTNGGNGTAGGYGAGGGGGSYNGGHGGAGGNGYIRIFY